MDNTVKEQTNNLSNDKIKDLKKLINELQENEHIEIFKIIKNDTDKYTENRNGIFVNMSNLQYSTLVKLQKFVNFCIENKKSFQCNKDKMETIKNMVSDENNERYSNIENQSFENEKIEYNISNTDFYSYKNKQEIIFNDVEKSLLKESFNNVDDKTLQKQKITGVNKRIMKKYKDNLYVNNTNI